MKNRLTLVLMTCLLLFALTGCGSEVEMMAVTRAHEDGEGIIFIDDEEVALVGSIQDATMTEEELVRAYELRVMAVQAFDIINQKREEAGLKKLVWDEKLEACAQVRAIEIQNTFSHTRPNGAAWYTVNANLMWGENLARGFKNASSLVDGWMKSPTHAANIMDGEFVTCSIAVYEYNDKLYFAQEFGY